MRVLSFVSVMLVVLVAVLIQPSSASPYRRNGQCACPRIYLPICGTDHVTYPNSCVMLCEYNSSYGHAVQLQVLHDGECE